MLLLRKEWIQLLQLTHSNDSVALWKEVWAHEGSTFQRITCKIHTVTLLQTTVIFRQRTWQQRQEKDVNSDGFSSHLLTALSHKMHLDKWHMKCKHPPACLPLPRANENTISRGGKPRWSLLASLLCCVGSQTCSRLWSRCLMIKVFSFGFCKFYMMEKPWGSLSSSSHVGATVTHYCLLRQ